MMSRQAWQGVQTKENGVNSDSQTAKEAKDKVWGVSDSEGREVEQRGTREAQD